MIPSTKMMLLAAMVMFTQVLQVLAVDARDANGHTIVTDDTVHYDFSRGDEGHKYTGNYMVEYIHDKYKITIIPIGGNHKFKYAKVNPSDFVLGKLPSHYSKPKRPAVRRPPTQRRKPYNTNRARSPAPATYRLYKCVSKVAYRRSKGINKYDWVEKRGNGKWGVDKGEVVEAVLVDKEWLKTSNGLWLPMYNPLAPYNVLFKKVKNEYSPDFSRRRLAAFPPFQKLAEDVLELQ